MPSPSPIRISDIPRNDIEAVRRYWMQGAPSPGASQMLIMLQDDPTELIAQMQTWSRGDQ